MRKKRINEDNLLPGYNKQYRNPSTFNYYNGLQGGKSNVGANNNPQPNQPSPHSQRTVNGQGTIPFNASNENAFVNELLPAYKTLTNVVDELNSQSFNYDASILAGALTNGVNISPNDVQDIALFLDQLKYEIQAQKRQADNFKNSFKQILGILGIINSGDYAQYNIKENKDYDINNKIKKVLREELKKYKTID